MLHFSVSVIEWKCMFSTFIMFLFLLWCIKYLSHDTVDTYLPVRHVCLFLFVVLSYYNDVCAVLCYSSSKPSSSDHITTRMVVLFSVSREYDEITFEVGELRRSIFLRVFSMSCVVYLQLTILSIMLFAQPIFCEFSSVIAYHCEW
jgi:hypothetical protein